MFSNLLQILLLSLIQEAAICQAQNARGSITLKLISLVIPSATRASNLTYYLDFVWCTKIEPNERSHIMK